MNRATPKMGIRVECYAGYRGEEEPRAFWLGERRLGVLELVDRGRLSQRDRRLLAMAATSGEALVDLANATLDLSRLEAGTESLDLRDFELDTLLAATEALMRPLAEQKGLALSLRPLPRGQRLHGDPGKIHRILVNLLRNAISFTEQGAVAFGAELQRGGEVGQLDDEVHGYFFAGASDFLNMPSMRSVTT